jgi:hypothetical protein
MTAPPTSVKRKHIPERTCVVCRQKAAKRGLTRLVRTPSGLTIDPGGKMNGRGAYLCDRKDCWEHAVKTGILNRALKMTLTEDDRQRLIQAMP